MTQPVDRHGREVLGFATTMQNLGLAKAAGELTRMLESEHWRMFVQAHKKFEFLPGEFDYFLTSQGITRDQVMAIRDIPTKARLEEAMDERKTGEAGYRRPIRQVRAEVPAVLGRQIEPYGLTKNEAKVLLNGQGGPPPLHRPALGSAVRRWTITGGVTTRKPNEVRPLWQRLAASGVRLSDEDLEALYEELRNERQKRRRKR